MSNNHLTICRICEESRETSLVNITLHENKDLVDEYLACANVSYNINDMLPKYFCHQCVSMLNDAYNFKRQCESTEKKLLQLLRIETNIKNLDKDQNDANPLEIIKMEYLIDTNANEENMESIESTNENDLSDFDQSILMKEESSEVDLIDNKLLLSVSNKSVKCYECMGMGFKCKSNFERHMLNHSKLYTCDICNKSFQVKKILIYHMKRHHGHRGDTPYKCNHCPKQFSTTRGLKLHQLYLHKIDKHSKEIGDKTYQCDKCAKKMTSANWLKRHILLQHTQPSIEKPYKCLLCTLKFRHKENLENHTLKHQTKKKPIPKKYICTICGHGFVSLGSLNNHMTVHSDERPYACNFCDSKFKLEASLKIHMRKHTTSEKPYKCLECDRAFNKKEGLKQHKKTHNNDRPYECPICKEKFRSPVTIGHMTRHTGEKPYNCENCAKSFITYHKLQRHLRTHTGIKPYACTLCNIGFVKIKTFEKHLEYHNANKSYKGTIDPRSGYHPIYQQYVSCSWCCGGFLTKRSLLFHQTKHSGGKSFTCQICGQGFSTENSLNEHEKVYHQNGVVQ